MADSHSFLLRFSGEVSTKARATRKRFVEQLVAAIEDALATANLTCAIDRRWSRLFVTSSSAEAGAVLARIFGVRSVSAAVAEPWETLADIVAAGREIFTPAVAGKRFAVRARRTAGHHKQTFSSPDLERALGAELVAGAAGVDLGHPEVTAGVEIHADRAWFYTDLIEAPSGLPMGVEGRALALISGGFDSAVASWEAWKRGVALDFVFFNLGGRQHEQGAVAVTERLARRWAYGDWPRLFSIDLRPQLEDLQAAVKPRYWQLALKALMYQAADRLAAELRLPALVTGEAVGQVSSQTLPNLALLDRVIERPILRPLVTWNKDDIVAAARRIGTYEISAEVPEFCSLAARHASTGGHAGEFKRAVATLDQAALAKAVAARTVREPRLPQVLPGTPGAVTADAIPKGATVVDLRSAEDYRQWHWPGSLNLEYLKALKVYRTLDTELSYVLYCEVGLKSAHLAELLQAVGIEAWHVPAGVNGLR